MEKGEVLVLSVQFGALILVVLLLSNFAYGTNSSSTPSITQVYWGGPPAAGGNGTSIGRGTNTEHANATQISFYYTLAPGTTLASASAQRFCTDPQNASIAGGSFIYVSIPRHSSNKGFYFSFTPVAQGDDWSCVYSMTIVDSLQQPATWYGTVVVKPLVTPAAS
ncbi:MAG: hypothetical protein OK456_05235 [Thaumarchaeota archaeon]|nr:hypothetical protein [Nitrososphaerota archaeon]